MDETKAKLLQKHQGKCRWCELHFIDGDIMEVDHLDRNRNHNDLSNKLLLHRHCHDARHAKLAESEKIRKRLADAGIHLTRPYTEETCEGKLSCTARHWRWRGRTVPRPYWNAHPGVLHRPSSGD